MSADGVGGLFGGEFDVGNVERGLAGPVQQPRRRASGEHLAFDTDDAGDVGAPFGARQCLVWLEHADDAALVAVATGDMTLDDIARFAGSREVAATLAQAGLVVLDLDDQADVALGGDFEMFF